VIALLTTRWWLILRAQGHLLPYGMLVGYRLAAFGVSYFTPGPQVGGEPLQIYLLRSRHAVAGHVAIAAVAIDRLLDLLANFTFLAGGFLLVLRGGLLAGSVSSEAVWAMSTLLALPASYLLALRGGLHPLAWFIARLPDGILHRGWAARLQHGFTNAEIQAAHFCRTRPLDLVFAMAISVLVWVAMAGEFFLALHFLGARLSISQVVAVLAMARLAFLSPSPGGLGAMEASLIWALPAVGTSSALAVSLGLLIRARDVILGGIGLWWGGLKSSQAMLQPLPSRTGKQSETILRSET